jgi:uncharacterized membrane protein
VAVLLALCSSAVYGAADFFGGLGAKRVPALVVVALSQLAGTLLVVLVVPVVGGTASARDILLGAAAGLLGALALALFYAALASGSMSVVAPVTAVCGAAVPVLAGLATGDALSPPALAGVVLALPAIALAASEGGLGALRSDLRGLTRPVLAGLGLGGVLLLLHGTSPGSGVWPLVASRSAAGVVVAGLLVARGVPLRVPRGSVPTVIATGTADTLANVLFLLAVRQGQLSVVGLLSSLYPVSTVLLAALLLHERLSKIQIAGVGGCTLAVLLIASS